MSRTDDPMLAGPRAFACAAAAAIAAAVGVALGAAWSVTALLAWDAAAIVFISWVWRTIVTADPHMTALIARSEDSRPTAEIVIIGAGTASLLAVGFTLARAGNATSPDKGLLVALAIGSVMLGWLSVHTVYLLHYARLYYGDPPGGIDFHGDKPDYLDFAYLALTIGMTFQVSDTDLEARTIRRSAVRHSLLSYLFGTVVVAVTINVVAGLLGH